MLWGDVVKRDNMITVDHGMKDVPPPPSSSRPQLEKHDIWDEPIPGAAHLALLQRCDWAFRIPTMQSGSHETLAACSLDAHPIAHSPQLHSDKQVKKKKMQEGPLASFSSLGEAAKLHPVSCAADLDSLCCVCWMEADYFLATVHWLCRLAKNEDVSPLS